MTAGSGQRGWAPGRLAPDVAGRRGVRGLWIVLGRHRAPFAVAVLAGIGTQGLGVVALVGAAVSVGTALEGGTASGVLGWGVVAAVAVLLRAGALWLEAHVSHELAYRILTEVRLWLFDAFARTVPNRGGRRTGDDVSAAMDDSQAMEMFYAHSLLYAAVAALLSPAVVVVLAFVDPVSAALTAGGVLVAGLGPMALRRANHRDGRDLRAALAGLNGDAVEVVDALPEVTALRGGRQLVTRLVGRGEQAARLQSRQSVRGALEQGLTSATAGVTVVAVVAWLLVRADAPAPLGALVVMALTVSAFDPLHTLIGATKVWGVTTAAADRVFDLLEQPASVPDLGAADSSRLEHHRGLELRGVRYCYPDASSAALKGVDFHVRPGETVALVGHSGAGKSTTALLVARLADPDAGSLLVGGISAADLPLRDLHRLVAIVPQDVFLVHDSLAANVRLGQSSVGDDELDRVLGLVGLDPVIARLPEGLHTVVGDRGARLSGGERQRVALARALLRRPRVLVIDEGTSMLDALSEQELRAAVASGSSDRATLVIAHRLSTVAAADRVIVLERGTVVGSGTHTELLTTSGAYRHLVFDQWQGLRDLLPSG